MVISPSRLLNDDVCIYDAIVDLSNVHDMVAHQFINNKLSLQTIGKQYDNDNEF